MLTANSRASHTAHAVLIAALVATTGLTTVVGLTDPAAPVFYPIRFLESVPGMDSGLFAAGFAAVHRRVWLLPLGLGWLAFLPNSPIWSTSETTSTSGVTSCSTDSRRGRASCSARCRLDGRHRFDRTTCDRSAPALELLGFGHPTKGGSIGYVLRSQTTSRPGGAFRAGIPDHLVVRGRVRSRTVTSASSGTKRRVREDT
jgi:hypothetical protein